jgi:hypothetical protein
LVNSMKRFKCRLAYISRCPGMAGQVRASIRLKPEVAEAWLKLDRTTRVQLGALFNQLVLLYARTGTLPPAPLDVLIESSDMALRWYTICRERVKELELELDRLKAELEEHRRRLG